MYNVNRILFSSCKETVRIINGIYLFYLHIKVEGLGLVASSLQDYFYPQN